MIKLSTHYALPARTAPPIVERFNQLLLQHQHRRRITFRGRKLTGEAALSAIVLRFLDLSEADQERVLAEYVPRFEAMLAGGDSPPLPQPDAADDIRDAVVVSDHSVRGRDTTPEAKKPKGTAKGSAKKRGEK